MEDAKEYQNFVSEKLMSIFGEDNVIKEWDVAKGSRDDYSRELYCPRIDLAVGPFNISRNIERDAGIISSTVNLHREFIGKLVGKSETNVGSVDDFLSNKNRNPRCFLAIEIEKSGTRKHMLGDIANASIIAAIGIVVPMTQSTLNGFKGIKKYVQFATSVGKLNPSFNNVLVVSQENFTQIISRIVNIVLIKLQPG